MNVLVIGGGGREHAICYSLKKSNKVDKLYCLPGNAGISEIATCVPEISATNIEKIIEFVESHKDIELTVVAPDDPLSMGLVDELTKRGHRAFGPNKNAAIIEASKAFSKDFMKKYGIPTATYETFDNYDDALNYLKTSDYPIVIKADGLALGKGVIICQDFAEAESGLKEIMLDKKFGSSGNTVVIEEFMTGKEVSILAFTDGKTMVPMVSSQDHKRAYDNDEGLNTGGMGTFSPSSLYDKEVPNDIYENIMLKTMDALNKEGRTFKGVIYFGLMLTPKGVKVLEYNARFGDPETQVVLPRLKTDLVDIFESIIDEKLADVKVEWTDKSTVCVILASGGYPESYKKGYEIEIGELDKNVILFHAGTSFNADGKLVTNGGRVIGVTAIADDIKKARELAYKNVKNVTFKDIHYRKDIGIKE